MKVGPSCKVHHHVWVYCVPLGSMNGLCSGWPQRKLGAHNLCRFSYIEQPIGQGSLLSICPLLYAGSDFLVWSTDQHLYRKKHTQMPPSLFSSHKLHHSLRPSSVLQLRDTSYRNPTATWSAPTSCIVILDSARKCSLVSVHVAGMYCYQSQNHKTQ